MGELIDDPFQAARLILTLRREGITDPGVLRAVETVPRSMFIEPDLAELAYEDCVLPIGCGQTLDRPSVIAAMLQALELGYEENLKVLIVGVGSGYIAALAMELAGHVAGIERFRRLADRAVRNLAQAGVDSVQIKHDDGLMGWQEHAPYDRILLTGAVLKIPDVLLGQLAKNGFCVAPVGNEVENELVCMNADRVCLKRHATVCQTPLRSGVSKAL